jgi:competence protein ComGC
VMEAVMLIIAMLIMVMAFVYAPHLAKWGGWEVDQRGEDEVVKIILDIVIITRV